MSGAVAPNIVTDGLVIYFDSINVKSYSTGSVWYDLSGKDNNGSLSGVIFQNNLAVFDGINDNVLTNYTDTPSTLSMEYVVRFTANSNTYVVAGKVGDSKDYWTGLWNQNIAFSMNNSVMDSGVTAILNRFYHVVCVFTLSRRLIYINGELKNDQSLVGATNPSNSLNISIFSNSFFTPMEMSFFRFYNRSLTQSEISQNFNATKTRFGL
jgi:hypothetical protein